MAQGKELDTERIKAAIEAIRNKEMGSYKASRVFNVSQTTVERGCLFVALCGGMSRVSVS
jgi:hypothetical protein